jgi:uncharacterized iron-regulated membrane protein
MKAVLMVESANDYFFFITGRYQLWQRKKQRRKQPRRKQKREGKTITDLHRAINAIALVAFFISALR